jgi:hypothetical protein
MHGSVRVCRVADFDVVVTDAPSADPAVVAMRERGVEVIHA